MTKALNLAIKRGIKLDLVYFEAIPHTSLNARNKVIELGNKLLNIWGTLITEEDAIKYKSDLSQRPKYDENKSPNTLKYLIEDSKNYSGELGLNLYWNIYTTNI